MATETTNTAPTESAHERATRKTLGYLVLLCCAILCMMGLLYHTLLAAQATPQAHPRATPTSTSAKPPALAPSLSA